MYVILSTPVFHDRQMKDIFTIQKMYKTLSIHVLKIDMYYENRLDSSVMNDLFVNQ
jgi:hypothetical protein